MDFVAPLKCRAWLISSFLGFALCSNGAPPTITTISPSAGTPGSTVTIEGTGFSATPAENIVFFGAVRGQVNSATEQTLSVLVPSGATYAPVTVNVAGLTAVGPSYFLPSFAGDGAPITVDTFEPGWNKHVGDGPDRTYPADLDGDGKPDLIVMRVYDHTLSLFRSVATPGPLSEASFELPVDLPSLTGTVDNPIDCLVRDLDGDGKLDLAVTDYQLSRITIFRNLAIPGVLDTNSFAAPVHFPLEVQPRGIRAADIDGDGRMDLAVGAQSGRRTPILRNLSEPGHLEFAAAVYLDTGTWAFDLALQDLDADGKPDLIVADANTEALLLFRNQNSLGNVGSFQRQEPLPTVGIQIAVISGDVDGDGRPDLLSGGYPGVISIFRNVSTSEPLSSASFGARVDVQVSGWVHNLALGDLNGDQRPEVIAVGEIADFMSVFENLSQPGSFTASSLGERVDYPTGWNAWGVSVGDLNGDGEPEIVFGNAYDDTITFYENKASACAVPAGLTAWWRAEGDAHDAVGSSEGQLQDGIAFAPGIVGQAFQFDGVDDFVLVNANSALDVGSGSGFTLECWLKPEGHRIGPILEWGTGSVGVHFWIEANDKLYANVIDTQGQDHAVVTAEGLVLDQAFQHVALTYDKASGLATIYHNGVAAASTLVGTFTPQTAGNLNLGARTAATTGEGIRYAGLMDEPALFNRALASSEIQAIYAAGDEGKCAALRAPVILTRPTAQVVELGASITLTVSARGAQPLSYQWRHDDVDIPGATSPSLTVENAQASDAGVYSVVVANDVGSATGVIVTLSIKTSTCVVPTGLTAWWQAEGDAHDAVGSSEGQLQGGIGFAPGMVGQAFHFDGVNDFVLVNANSALDIGSGSGFTLECWIKPEGHRVGALLEWGSQAVGVHFWIESGDRLYGNLVDTQGQNHQIVTGEGLVLAQVFQHVALTYEKATGLATIYHNGVAIVSTLVGTFTPRTAVDLNLGARTAPTTGQGIRYAGLMDEPGLFNRALDSSEIQAIYAAGDGGKCTPQAPLILTRPTDLAVPLGDSVTLTMRAIGVQPLTYQWRHDEVDIPGATSLSLTIENAQASDAGVYSVIVANDVGSATGVIATLVIVRRTPTISLGEVSQSAGFPISLPVFLRGNGDENSLSFSLNFDPERLTFESVDLGSDAADGLLLLNTSQVADGILGVALALPANTAFPAGASEVLRISFATTLRSGRTLLHFSDQPIQQLLSDIHAQQIEAVFQAAYANVVASPLEGDCAPRPVRDNVLTILDWVQVGRFVAGLDSLEPGEFPRVDCAPRATLGDGELKVTDWVQAGRYAAALDPLAIAGGPSEPVPPSSGGGGSSSARTVSVGKGEVGAGGPLTVPVTLQAQGDENAIGFTLAYDPAVFAFSSATKGSAAGSATLNVNAGQAASGRLGIALALPLGTHFAAGSREVVKVTFYVDSSATEQQQLSFADQPVAMAISDQEAHELAATYASGFFTVIPSPSLSIRLTENQTILSWPSSATGLQLQVSGSLAPTDWTLVTTAVQTSDGENIVVLPRVLGPQYFRLRHP